MCRKAHIYTEGEGDRQHLILQNFIKTWWFITAHFTASYYNLMLHIQPMKSKNFPMQPIIFEHFNLFKKSSILTEFRRKSSLELYCFCRFKKNIVKSMMRIPKESLKFKCVSGNPKPKRKIVMK